MPPLAEAFVRIRPQTDSFERESRAGISKAGPALGREGAKHGRLFGTSFVKATAGPFRSIAGVVGGPLAAAFAVIGGAHLFKDFIGEAREAQKSGALTAAVLKSTGGVAHVSARQVGELATAISNKVGVDDEEIQAGENMLLTFRGIRNEAGKGNDIFNQATSVLTDMTAALNGGVVTGENLRANAVKLGRALNDPVKGMTALTRAGVTFTDAQKKQITELVKSGHALDAQKIILAELNKEFGGAAAAQTTAGQKLGVVWKNIEEQLGTALLPVLDKVENALAVALPVAVRVGGRVFGVISTAVRGLFDLLVKGDFSAAFRKAFHVEEDSPLVDFLLRLRQSVLDLAATWLPRFRTALEAVGSFVTSKVVPALAAMGQFVVRNRDYFITFGKVVLVIVAALKLWAAAQAAVTALLAVNPVGAVVVAVAALTAGVIQAYKHSERFREIIATVWAALQQVGGFLARTFTPTWHALAAVFERNILPALQQLWAVLQRNMPAFIAVAKVILKVDLAVLALYLKLEGFLLPILVRVGGFLVGRLVNFIAETINQIGRMIRAVQAAWGAFQTFLRVVSGVWSGFVTIVRGAVAAVVDKFFSMAGLIVHAAAFAFGWIPGIGPKLKDAAAKFDQFRAGVNAALRGINDQTVSVTANITYLGPGGTHAFAAGGRINIGTTATADDVLIRASRGETVVSAQDSAQPEFQAWAAARRIPGFARGGAVGFDVNARTAGLNHTLALFHAGLQRAAQALARFATLAVPGAPAAVSGNAAIVRTIFASMFGWTGANWNAAYRLIMGESGFRTTAQNPTSTAYGMFQFLNSTWAGVGGYKTADPRLQAIFGGRYIAGKYGSPLRAYSAWLSRSPHWYARGMQPTVFSTPTLIGVGERGRETVSVTPAGAPDRPVRLHPKDILALGEVMGHVVLRGVASGNYAAGRTADLYMRSG